MNKFIIYFMMFFSVTFICLIPMILIYDIIKLIHFLINGSYLSKYTEPISVKCTDLTEVKVTRSRRRGNYTNRETACIMRPSFSGFYNDKNLTFCRKKDWQQPVAKVGNYYTIYIKPGSIDCHDYYEEQEKQFLRKKRAKKILLYNLAMIFMVLWIVTTIFVSL